ncbi:hypothetical protein PL11201_440005 [Planktothrix sp. PCC 11201]|nr:hypothetical protein PL11201_440005 [Planktothrix sp. PCC 11201]
MKQNFKFNLLLIYLPVLKLMGIHTPITRDTGLKNNNMIV